MKSFWKKAGWLGLAILPLVIGFALQVVLVLAVVFFDCVLMAVNMVESGMVDPEWMTLHALETVNENLTLITLAYHIIGLAVFGLWYYLGCGRPRPVPVSPVKVFTWRSFAITLLMGFSMCLAASGLLASADYVVPDVIQQYEELMEAAGLGSDPLIIFASVLIAPIGEELMCRGVVFCYAGRVVKGMRSRTAAFWIANAIQALVFGVMHGNLVQGTYAFLMGLGLGWLRGRYRSLYASMLAHFTINFSSTYLLGYALMWVPETLPACVAVMLVGIVATVLLMYWESRRDAAQALQ